MYNLIIVDDEKTIREGLQYFYWEKLGYRVSGAFSNGEKAIEFLNEHEVDVVITDIKMPVLDGLALAEWIKVNRKGMKVILLSVYKEFEYARRALLSEVYTYLLKPINLQELESTMSELITELKDDAGQFPKQKKFIPDISLKRTTTTSAVVKAIKYMNDNYAESISLQQLASIVELNSCYFSSQFKQVTGRNYLDYLIELRIAKARNLLEMTNFKIYEISYKIGYENTKYFSDVFKRKTGMTPSEFRMSFWEE